MDIHLNDMDYDAAAIREHRESIIVLRDSALEGGHMAWAVLLSVTIGLLEELAKTQEA